MYFPAGNGLHFVGDGLSTEFHPGRWYHLVITWKQKTIAMYVNGRLAEKTLSRSLATPANKGLCNRVQLSPYEPIGIFRDVRLYGKALLPEEVENAWDRYVDPKELKAVVPRSLEIKARRLAQPRPDFLRVPCGQPGGKCRADPPDSDQRPRQDDAQQRSAF